MTASRFVRTAIPVAVVFMATAPLFAGPITPVVTISTVADTATLIPAGGGTFTSFNPGLTTLPPNPLIAAKLNIGNFSDPDPVSGTISEADGLLAGFAGKLPYSVKTSSSVGQAMVNDADLLEKYNSGAPNGRLHTVGLVGALHLT